MSRTVIVGGPKTGKTTLASAYAAAGIPVIRTDGYRRLGWSAASAAAARAMDRPGPLVVEGVASARALRKWLSAHPTGRPCDEVVVLDRPHGSLTPGQAAMAKGVHTVLAGIEPELRRRGVAVRRD
jgi:dephospho-CoA kinase